MNLESQVGVESPSSEEDVYTSNVVEMSTSKGVTVASIGFDDSFLLSVSNVALAVSLLCLLITFISLGFESVSKSKEEKLKKKLSVGRKGKDM